MGRTIGKSLFGFLELIFDGFFVMYIMERYIIYVRKLYRKIDGILQNRRERRDDTSCQTYQRLKAMREKILL